MCGAGLSALLHTCVTDDTALIVVAGTNDLTEATLPVFNPYDEISDLEIFVTKELIDFEAHQTFPLDKGEKGIASAATAFRDIPLVIPIRA